MYDQEQLKQLLEMKETLGVQIDHFNKNSINPRILSVIKRKLVKIASLKKVSSNQEIIDDESNSEIELQAQIVDEIPANLYKEYEQFYLTD